MHDIHRSKSRELIQQPSPLKEKLTLSRCHWLTSVILAIWEVEMGRIVIRSQPRQKKVMILHFDGKEMGMVACACHSSDGRKHKTGRL
jgi:hypothetical protein